MPLDGTPAPFDPALRCLATAPDLTTPTPAGLAWLLRNPVIWSGRMVFDFGISLERDRDEVGDSCGTSGCAIGLAWLTWGGASSRWDCTDSFTDMYTRLGMDYDSAQAIFYSPSTYGVEWSDVTPDMVADKIDEWLAGWRLRRRDDPTHV